MCERPGSASVTLLEFYERAYRPARIGESRHSRKAPSIGAYDDYASQFRTAIRWLAEALDREPTLADLNPESVAAAVAAAAAAGCGPAWQRVIRRRIATIWRFAYRLGLVEKYSPQCCTTKMRRRTAPREKSLPPGPQPGTVLHFFESVYCPQRMVDCAPLTIKEYRAALLRLRKHYGRDITLAEQTDALAAEHFYWLLHTEGLLPVTVNNSHRGPWFSIWRFAVENGQAQHGPTVKKLREQHDAPDAWSYEEASAILDATSGLSDWSPIGGVSADKYWRAMLLVAWWAGLRRGSLWRLRHRDFDLDGACVTVAGSDMKNGRGRRYTLGPDAVDAVRAAWNPPREYFFARLKDDRRFYEYFDELLRVAGVAPSTRRGMTKLHKWRRTVGTYAAVNAGIHAACALLNHSSTEVTKRYIDPTKLPGNNATEFLPTISATPAVTAAAGGAVRRAAELIQCGDYVAAGVWLRVALERCLRRLCRQHHCEPPKKVRRAITPWHKALVRRGVLDQPTLIKRVIKTLNCAAHGRQVEAHEMRQALAAVRALTSNEFRSAG